MNIRPYWQYEKQSPNRRYNVKDRKEQNRIWASAARELFDPVPGKPVRMGYGIGEIREEFPQSTLQLVVVSNMPRGTHRTSSR